MISTLYSILQHHKTLIFTRGSNISIYFYESLRTLKNNDFFNISSLFLADIDEEACFQYEGRHQKFLLPKPASQPQYKKVKVTWWQIRSTDYEKFLFKAEIASFTTNVMNLYLLAATGRKRCYITTKHSIIWINRIIDYLNVIV